MARLMINMRSHGITDKLNRQVSMEGSSDDHPLTVNYSLLIWMEVMLMFAVMEF